MAASRACGISPDLPNHAHAAATAAYIADTGNNLIRTITIGTGAVSTLAGIATAGITDGIGTNARFAAPRGIVWYAATNALLIADTGNNRLRLLTLTGVNTSTLAGGGIAGADGRGSAVGFASPYGLALVPASAGAPALAYIAETGANRLRALPVAGGR